MKKYILILLLFFLSFFFNSCSLFFKTALSIKNPKVENNEDIMEYLEDTDCPIQNTFVVSCPPDSLQIYQNLMKGFTNEILIYRDSIRYCYEGTNRCTSEKLKKTIDEFYKYYTPCQSDTIDFEVFMSQLLPLSKNANLQIEHGKIYIFAYWSIFFGSKKNKKEYFNWLFEYKNKYPDKYEIILVNVDLNNDWGLENDRKLKLIFKMNKKNSVDLEFGKMPYKE
ncbi:MAG: hypothetical protein JXR68_08080 [Bacteroidales bacterium]|nr:hypothetical protein [Bacteroidales bacterium]